ncbi:Lrp/AsnC ligand binding domain-containing protein [Candidatus Hecatella orcuttiae]|uniref:Lrp/AsnC family transcriptional regulator n=1 Tax=Candidatus Hecatella orcuttiae TaxID=1935119 RepID=UPI0028681985|nr:Lrp/AsnC ligand binding domain-containing protein [Candidatus Hecatella orcuttiae]
MREGELMVLAFVMVNVEPGTEKEVAKAVTELKSVKDVYFVYGIYDLIAKIEAETDDELKDCIAEIRKLENVKSTLTMTVIWKA